MAHGQGAREASRTLTACIPHVRLAAVPESAACCGSAGIDNLTQPDMALRLRAHRGNHVRQTGAQTVAAGNPGCLAWIGAGLAERGLPSVRVAHPVTLLAEALG